MLRCLTRLFSSIKSSLSFLFCRPGLDQKIRMGMMSPEQEQSRTVTHFSHSHPLEITNLPENHRAACSGCGFKIFPGKAYYSCLTCDFCLHGTCYGLPRKISHPTHPNHHLMLVLSPSFRCQGCGDSGVGFSYCCKVCSQDYHSLCTLKPLSVSHGSHSHPLTLEFGPAYGGKGFRCDLCRNPGGLGQWFYSCSGCGFDIHLDCAESKAEPQKLQVQVPVNQVESYSNRSLPDSAGFGSAGTHVANPVTPFTPITSQRSPPVGNTSSPMGTPQFNPGGSSSYYANGTPRYGINNDGIPMVNGAFPVGSYAGNNQTVFLRPTSGVQTTTLLQPNGSTLSYATPMGVVPSQGGAMTGMSGVFMNGVASGVGQQVGQEMFRNFSNEQANGSGSGSDSNGISDILDCWFGGV